MTRDQEEPGGYGEPPKSKRFAKGNTPHNKREVPSDSLKKAASRALDARRTVLVGDKEKMMSARESLVREDVQKAVSGSVASICRLVKLMIQHPELIEGQIEYRVFITGAAARL